MLISEQIPQLEELRAQGQPVVSTTLYQAATESWLEHDNSKHYLAREHKPRLVAALAAHLWRTGTTLLPISDLNDWFHLWRSSDPALQARYASADADRLEEDLRTATFLAREDGARAGFRFAHTSLQEYFLAPHLAQAVERDDPEAWAGPVPSGETLTFLGELFASDYSEAFPTLSSWCQTYRPMVSELIFTYARHAHERDLPTPSLRSIDLHGIDLDDLTVLGRADKPVDLTGADFTGCSLRRAVFSHVILRGARFTDACLTQATFDRCTCTDTVWPEELPESTWSGSIASLTALDQESGIYWFSDGNGLPTWSPEGCQVAAISGSTVRVWDPTTGQVLTTLTGHTDTVTAIAWSPDSTRIATTSRDRTARVWDPTTGQTLTTLTGHTDTVTAIAWDPDSTRIATTSDDQTARVWDPTTGKTLTTLTGHTRGVTGTAWSPDGTRIATSAADGTWRIWAPKTGETLRVGVATAAAPGYPAGYASWRPGVPQIDVLEGGAWRWIRIQGPGAGRSSPGSASAARSPDPGGGLFPAGRLTVTTGELSIRLSQRQLTCAETHRPPLGREDYVLGCQIGSGLDLAAADRCLVGWRVEPGPQRCTPGAVTSRLRAVASPASCMRWRSRSPSYPQC